MHPRARTLTLTLAAVLAGTAAPAGAAPRSPAAVLAAADARLAGRADAEGAFPNRTGSEPGRSLAPYFVVRGDGGGEVERLPLEETRADVQVAGVLAQVTLTQTFRNSGRKPIEAVYVFPASTRAAVHAMRIRVGARTVEAHIARRADARAEYEAARQDGKRAALLEEERANVFTMSVANVMPGDRLVAELTYSELIVPEQGVYELVTPTVVGPRYTGGADPAKDRWAARPTLHQGEAAPYRFGFTAHLETALPLRGVESPSHALRVDRRAPTSADVALAAPGEGGGDRDVVLRWRLAGDRVEAGVLLFPAGPQGGWFLAQVEPPARVPAAAIPPREYVFVLDVSGSMHGFPLDTAKALMAKLLPRLRPEDSFNVVFFSGGSRVLSPGRSLPATPENVQKALAVFGSMGGGGGTELLQALEAAYALPRADRRTARSVVVVTDGYVTVEAPAFKLVREHLDEASCFAFGIGSSVNRGLIEALARAGQGEPAVVLSPADAAAAADRLARIVEAPVLSHVQVRFDGLDARDVLPGHLPDLLAERPVVVLGRYEGAPRGRVVVTGESARGRFERALEIDPAAARAEHAPLRVLWARRWVELLDDEHHLAPAKELEEAVTDLGLSHAILTRFTSFVAVDSEVVNRGGQATRVDQPLPLPQGVSDLAVGGAPRMAAKLSRGFASLGGAGAAAPNAPHAAPVQARREAEHDRAAEARAQPEEKPRKTPPAAVVLRESARGVDRTPALRDAALAALGELARGGTAGTFLLRLHLGADGKVTKVEVLSTHEAAVRAALERRLVGLASAARPSGSGPATLELEVRLTAG
jgi:Ca-activated chloride channel family protein